MNKCEICGIKPLNKLRNGKCDKCYIKYGNNKVRIPFNKDSWDSYDDFKNWQFYYDQCSAEEVPGADLLGFSK